MKDNVWIVIPAHNEEKNISDVIRKTKNYSKNIAVVDDGSKDETYSIAKKNNVMVLRHIVNLGKGAALKTGCEYAVRNKAEKIIVMDSDGQHNPKDIPRFAKELKNNDVVFSYRKYYHKIPLILRLGNILINTFISCLYHIKLKDTQCGFRAFSSKAYKKISWNSWGYEVESEMIANTGKHKLKYSEIPIETVYKDRYKGTSVIDGIKIVYNLVWWKISAFFAKTMGKIAR